MATVGGFSRKRRFLPRSPNVELWRSSQSDLWGWSIGVRSDELDAGVSETEMDELDATVNFSFREGWRT